MSGAHSRLKMDFIGTLAITADFQAMLLFYGPLEQEKPGFAASETRFLLFQQAIK
jgi:hypothetical protein